MGKPFVDFPAFKQLITVRQALELLGWRHVWSRGELCRGPCPVHGSSSPDSRSLTVTSDQWYCHKCKKGGDVTRLWALLHQLSDYAAVLDLAERLKVKVPTRR